MKTTLTEDCLWRGVLYLAGDREIPEELAIALNLSPRSATVADLPSEEPQTTEPEPSNDDDAVHRPTSSPGTEQREKRRVKRG